MQFNDKLNNINDNISQKILYILRDMSFMSGFLGHKFKILKDQLLKNKFSHFKNKKLCTTENLNFDKIPLKVLLILHFVFIHKIHISN